jgi:hypothetical protein
MAHPAELFVADTRVVVRQVGVETLLVPVSSGVGDLDSIYVLSDVGSAVWSMLAEPISFGDIVSRVCAEYDVEPEHAARDVDEFLEELKGKKLVHNASRETD